MMKEEPRDERNDELSYQERLKRLRQAMYSRSLSQGLMMRQRREMNPIDYHVPDSWEPKEVPTPGMAIASRVISIAHRAMWWMLALAVCFFIASAGIFFYYFTIGSGGTLAAPGNIEISIRGSATAVGGEPSQLQIIVVNRNQAALELADLVVKYPDGTRSPTDFITALPQQRISLGTIESGGRRQGTVSAVLIGKDGEQAKILTELEYRVANSNAIFVAEKEYAVTFSNSPISVSLQANAEAISGQRIILTAHVTSDSDVVLRDALFKMEYPFGFVVESRDPAPKQGDLWELGDLRPGEDHLITVRGTLKGQEGDERVFRAIAGIRKEAKTKAIDVALAESVHRIAIAKPFIGIGLIVNADSSTESVSVSPGQTINITVPWVNNLPVRITDAVIVARLSGLAIQKDTVRTADGFYRSTDNTVLWDKTTTKDALRVLEPGARGAVSFSFQMPSESNLLNVREASLEIAIHAAGKRIAESSVPETLQSSVTRTLKLASCVKLIAQGFYYSNPFGSVGPLPPKVDEETTYALVFTVLNTSNQIKDAKITAQLPPYIRWIGVYSPAQERVTFNTQNGSMEWNIGNIAQDAGIKEVPGRQVAFAVGFTPSTSQIGQQPDLIRNVVLSGMDAFTGGKVTVTQTSVTTNLIDDPGFSALESNVVQ